MITEALACRKSDGMADWYVIERRDHDGRSWLAPVPGIPGATQLCCSSRIGNADVEGTGDEMIAIAKAIKAGTAASFRWCAVSRPCDGAVELYSPRNSDETVEVVSLAVAYELADDILVELRESTESP